MMGAAQNCRWPSAHRATQLAARPVGQPKSGAAPSSTCRCPSTPTRAARRARATAHIPSGATTPSCWTRVGAGIGPDARIA